MMRLRSFRLCLSLLASIGVNGASSAIADPAFPTGEARMVVSPHSPSSFPVDLRGFPICGPTTPGGVGVQCVAIVKPDIGNQTVIEEGFARFEDLHLRSAEPVETSCGLWDLTLTLDPTQIQPPSPIVFDDVSGDVSGDAGHGTFSGALDLHAQLNLVHRETGETADFPLRLKLGLAGPWAQAPAEEGEPPQLFLLASSSGGKLIMYHACFPLWVYRDPDIEIIHGEGCDLCFKPYKQTDDAVDLPLDSPFPIE